MSVTRTDAAATLTQFVRYGAVGVLGTVLHFGSTILLVERFGASPVAASGIGFLIAFVAQYLLNRSWVFASRAGMLAGVLRYAVVCGLGLALSLALMHAVTVWGGWSYLWGLVAVVAIVPVTNFSLNRAWTFAPPSSGR